MTNCKHSYKLCENIIYYKPTITNIWTFAIISDKFAVRIYNSATSSFRKENNNNGKNSY
jgi:hypothetical protein